MARPTSPQLTEAEQRIMDQLWAMGEASVRQLTEALEPKYGLAYTTVLTTVRIMADKGYVDFRKDGRAHIFRPTLSREGAQRKAIGSVMQSLFGGSPRELAQHLVAEEQLTLDDIEALRAELIAKHGDRS
ncbi:MAG: BlaI/MecI/CopY family transcriptional regulator [Maricaulis sp.]|jgi:predicted transcriptional regulator|uniref:BlaI/MecI/CopY family transcriptional regulator n=1 Tax=Maricaulis sp. TaxID=1486257 RepID=UPI001B2C0B72|nr:BlaI/MecI/CopY family transcriptional regulator [Maricaulis sp.]MBO6728204.1 BlaI/MecI/CopY family transcriptional regulator [Maricaulis sp.]MBO6846749.1 BlaI/MecI/CopY family transcriptional regulator [Maricaulis sp.]MBO6877890.1 BlaI/MecI/CopY family transcriptional regulator [Maricaulis sp.]MDM7985348.1 BlaI/MecI/CopY family transcriptional regulator [Maricaulis sp.]